MIVSFGHRNGPVRRASKTFDVRDLSHDTLSDDFSRREIEIFDYVRTHPGEMVAIGCDKGTHRSCVLANRVATAARTSVMHRDK